MKSFKRERSKMCVLILHLHPKHFSLFISSSLSLSFDSVSAHLLLFLSCWTKKTKGVVLHPHKKPAIGNSVYEK